MSDPPKIFTASFTQLNIWQMWNVYWLISHNTAFKLAEHKVEGSEES